MVSLLLLIFALSSSSAHRLLSLGEEDSTVLADGIIEQLKSSFPEQFAFPKLSYAIASLQDLPAEAEDDTLIVGNVSSLPGLVGDTKTLHRASPVVSYASGDNLTISTSVSFGTLRVTWPRSELNILGVSMAADSSASFRQNEFAVSLTIYNDPGTGACAVDLKKAGFSVLSAIDVSVRPVGFFNQIHLDATVHHLSQAIFKQLTYVDNYSLQSMLQAAICTAVPH